MSIELNSDAKSVALLTKDPKSVCAPIAACSSDLGYEQPIPGHAICNIGDAMTIFSGGILRSNLHRVVYVLFLTYSV